MAKIFRWLLMAAQGGPRYIRAILRSVTGVSAKATTAPGSDMEVGLKTAEVEASADGITRPSAGGSLWGKVGSIKMVAEIITKLVSDTIFYGRTSTKIRADIESTPASDEKGDFQTAILTVPNIESSPSSDGKGDFLTEMSTIAQSDTPPGYPIELKTKPHNNLTAKLGTTPPEPMFGHLTAKSLRLGVIVSEGTPNPFVVGTKPTPTKLYAATSRGTAVGAEGKPTVEATTILASIHTWRSPTKDGNSLYIPQVYSYQRDGTNLKIM